MRLPIAKKIALWSDFEGRVLEGRYRLGQLVRSEGRVAWFDTEAGEERRPAVVSLTETLNDEGHLLERLQAAAEIRHPNVVAIYEVGSAKLDGMPLVYAVMEPVEQSLSDVLRRRTLTATETRQVVDALVDGLGAVHEKGLVHGRVEASSVLAMGETVKLRSDCIQMVEQGVTFEACAAEDLRGVSAIIGQALPQRLVAEDGGRAHPMRAVPVGVIRHEVKNGIGMVQIASALRGGGVAEKPAVPSEPAVRTSAVSQSDVAEGAAQAVPVAPVVAPVSAVAAAAVTPVASVAQTVPVFDQVTVTDSTRHPKELGARETREAAAEDGPQLPLRFEARRQTQRPLVNSSMTRKSAPYIAGAAAVVLIVLALVLHGMMHHAPSAAGTAVAASSVATVPAPRPAVVVAPSAPFAPSVPTGALRPSAAEGAVKVWRVVAYTYNQRNQAESKAGTIAAKHPQFSPEVFSPNGRTYLVTLGGTMDRDGAFKMRAEALRAGMPGDTFARNYRGGAVVSAIK
jgi:hypothetical protein